MTRTANADHKIPHRVALAVGAALGLALMLAGCGASSSDSEASAPSGASASASTDLEPDTKNADHPDVLRAVLERDSNGSWSLDVTLSSEYDSPQRYADGWRVMDASGNVLGEHTLDHDHADEQPVTRTQSNLEIPDDVDVVTVEGRDTENGFGGAALEVTVPR
ncbi:hypothetical protein C6I20_06550 [Aeromicrobium sp. A1-2]|uniref:hypothetical protein n=1 Tax=Aeromicrobium sp. A1-2 TaxID=2107713 RepID=UPI000E466CD6|nr:hypothetical protein [Aeromicrobium sp. A1-2]AXT84886.1 hypothetical protein C6I20_06550 [Aeromicrobium sp. A1-2]